MSEWAWLYLAVGGLNAAHGWVRGQYLSGPVVTIAEIVFNLLLWPVQALCWVLFVGIPTATEWLYLTVTGER